MRWRRSLSRLPTVSTVTPSSNRNRTGTKSASARITMRSSPSGICALQKGHLPGASLNVHVEFPRLQALALPITVGTAMLPGLKIHYARMVDCQANPPDRPDRLRNLHGVGRQTLRLPADRQGNQGCPHLCAFPPTVMRSRSPRKQLFHHQTRQCPRHNSRLEAAYHKGDASIRNVIQLLEAARDLLKYSCLRLKA